MKWWFIRLIAAANKTKLKPNQTKKKEKTKNPHKTKKEKASQTAGNIHFENSRLPWQYSG